MENDFEYYTNKVPKLMLLLKKPSTTIRLYIRLDYDL